MKRIFLLLLVSMLIFISCSTESFPDNPFQQHYIDMWANTLEPYEVDIAFYGDSRVAGADWSSAFPNKSVVNLGIGGDIVEGTIQRLPLLDALDIKHCFLAIGGNNCLSSKFSSSDFKAKYDKLLGMLKDRDITVYANTIAGITSDCMNLNQKDISKNNNNIITANSIIAELCQKHGVILIDMAKLMNNNDGTLKHEYSSDGVHFNDLGNDLWFNELRPYIESI